jgi:hypothetical protein
MRFRKKPIIIEAVQFNGSNCFVVAAFMGLGDLTGNNVLHSTDTPVIHTLEGDLTASPGDWIIKGVNGEFYPCKPDIFDKLYDPI